MVLYCENIVSDIVLLFLKNIGYCFVFFLKSNIVLGFVLPAQGGKNIVSGIVLPTKEDKNIVWDIVCSIEILGENIGYCFKFFMLLKYCFGFVMGFQKSKEYCIWYCIVILRYWVENIGYWVCFVWSSNIVLGIVLPSKWGYCRALLNGNKSQISKGFKIRLLLLVRRPSVRACHHYRYKSSWRRTARY